MRSSTCFSSRVFLVTSTVFELLALFSLSCSSLLAVVSLFVSSLAFLVSAFWFFRMLVSLVHFSESPATVTLSLFWASARSFTSLLLSLFACSSYLCFSRNLAFNSSSTLSRASKPAFCLVSSMVVFCFSINYFILFHSLNIF